jgi:hypothetical protein
MEGIGKRGSEKCIDEKCSVDGVIQEILSYTVGHKYQQRYK